MTKAGPRDRTAKRLAREARDRRIVAAIDAGLSVREVGRLFGVSAARACQVARQAQESLALRNFLPVAE